MLHNNLELSVEIVVHDFCASRMGNGFVVRYLQNERPV